jgi:hypothetical protein
MDGWMDGSMDGWMDGWQGRWQGRWASDVSDFACCLLDWLLACVLAYLLAATNDAALPLVFPSPIIRRQQPLTVTTHLPPRRRPRPSPAQFERSACARALTACQVRGPRNRRQSTTNYPARYEALGTTASQPPTILPGARPSEPPPVNHQLSCQAARCKAPSAQPTRAIVHQLAVTSTGMRWRVRTRARSGAH